MIKKSRISVLHFCEHFGGRNASLHGVARTFQWWIPLFDSDRFRILLCSRKKRDKAAEQMEASGLNPFYLSCGKLSPMNLFKLIKILKSEQVDIIHAHGFGACIWARIAGLIRNVPVIVHGRANYRKVPLILRPIEKILGPGTKHALAVSESTKLFMAQKRYIPEKSIQVLYNGLLPENINLISETRRRGLREKFTADSNTIVIGVVGRIVSHKGHIDLFRAVEKIIHHFPGIRIWTLGDGDCMPELEKWVCEHNFQDKVIFTGFVRNVIEMIQCFDIQVFPSHLEGTPNTLFEALAVGNCIVSSDTDGQAEILEHKREALVYPAGNINLLAEHLTFLIKDENMCSALRKKALERSADFDGHKTIAAIQAVYENIVPHFS